MKVKEIAPLLGGAVEVRAETGPNLILSRVHCGWDGIGQDCADEVLALDVAAVYAEGGTTVVEAENEWPIRVLVSDDDGERVDSGAAVRLMGDDLREQAHGTVETA